MKSSDTCRSVLIRPGDVLEFEKNGKAVDGVYEFECYDAINDCWIVSKSSQQTAARKIQCSSMARLDSRRFFVEVPR